MCYEPDHNQFVNSEFFKLQIKIGICEVAGTQVLRDNVAAGTFIEIERPNATRWVVGFIPLATSPLSPRWHAEGHIVAVIGGVGLDGEAVITMTDPNQLVILD